MSQQEHKADAPASVQCVVLTISDTRTEASDASGRAIAEMLATAGHTVTDRRICKDDPSEIASLVRQHAADRGVDVIITTGGTGLSSRDSSYEAISALFDKRLDGFGELFRMLSYHDIGPAAMLSRACAGLVSGTVVVALPGAEGAVRLAMAKLLLPELGHVVQQAKK